MRHTEAIAKHNLRSRTWKAKDKQRVVEDITNDIRINRNNTTYITNKMKLKHK